MADPSQEARDLARTLRRRPLGTHGGECRCVRCENRDCALIDAALAKAKADALRTFADERVKHQSPGRIAEDLHAEADRIEAEP